MKGYLGNGFGSRFESRFLLEMFCPQSPLPITMRQVLEHAGTEEMSGGY
jgi:hypothetical protein